MRKLWFSLFSVVVVILALDPWRSVQSLEEQKQEALLVGMTLVPDAVPHGAVCLDGSPAAYHLHRGSGAGARNWLLQFEGGGWCNDVASCLERSRTRRGSTRYMNRLEVFAGILSNNSTANPDFYNWNRVKLRYCDGASFAGDLEYHNGTITLYFRGQKIWDAIIHDLIPKGLIHAEKVLLSGCSAGGLATFLHCDGLAQLLPENATVKCLSDAGFFLDVRDISGNYTIRPFFSSLVTLQGIQKNLNKDCITSHDYAYQCFFPQYALQYIKTPYFILNSAYDVYQFHHIFIPPSADPRGHWSRCKLNLAACTPNQISILQGLRSGMLNALRMFEGSINVGMFIDSCFAHCQSEIQELWFAPNSPRIHNKTIAEAVGDWYFERNFAKEVDCPYPCDSTCHNFIVVPSSQILIWSTTDYLSPIAFAQLLHTSFYKPNTCCYLLQPAPLQNLPDNYREKAIMSPFMVVSSLAHFQSYPWCSQPPPFKISITTLDMPIEEII